MSKRWQKLLLIGTHMGGWVPLIVMIIAWSTGNLTFNPVQAATIRTGRTAIIFLVLSLMVTPLNTLFGLRQLFPLRRWFGLYTFLYAMVHVSIWLMNNQYPCGKQQHRMNMVSMPTLTRMYPTRAGHNLQNDGLGRLVVVRR